MRKLVITEFLTADGVMEAPDEWHGPYFDDDMANAVAGQMTASDGLLIGRTTYDGFAAAWPAMPDAPGADHMNNVAKYVVSNTLDQAGWNNSTVIGGKRAEIADTIRELKSQNGKNIAVMGSATLVRFLLDEGLADEIELLIDPVIVGRGKRLFPEGLAPIPLTVVSSTTFASGVQHVVYAPAQG